MTHEPTISEYLYLQRIKRAGGLITYKEAFIQSYQHAEFLDSPPKLGDFVPTNEDGEVIEKPKAPESDNGLDILNWHKEMLDYTKAVSRVLWKGWEIKDGFLTNGREFIGYYEDDKFEFTTATYEKLITSGVKLERIEKK